MAARDGQLTLSSGPWRRVMDTNNPLDGDEKDVLQNLVNGVMEDPVGGGAACCRPGFFRSALTPGTGVTQAVMGIMTSDGSIYNFSVVAGRLYRGATDVTPANILLHNVLRVGWAFLNDTLTLNDGINKPVAITNFGGSPVTGVYIDAVAAATFTASLSTAFPYFSAVAYTPRTFGSIAAQGTVAAGLVTAFTGLGAGGTIPANLWGVFLLEVNNAGAYVITTGAGNAAGYASEAAALAGLPARATTSRHYVGYLIVRASAGFTWTAGTDGFFGGGAAGNNAQATTYGAGEGNAWSAFGRPVVWTGALFFIASQVNAVYARSTILWSEPNQPLVGYRQTTYDNAWTLSQTSAYPLYALAATNETLFYFRRNSVGGLTGAPGVNFENTATHDVISRGVGCVAWQTIAVWGDTVYFTDDQCRPYRVKVGGQVESLWRQCAAQFPISDVTLETQWFTVLDPSASVVLNFYGSNCDTARVFDAETGFYLGTWNTPGAVALDIGGFQVQSGGQVQTVLHSRSVASAKDAWRLPAGSEVVNGADDGTPISWALTAKLAYSMKTALTFSAIRAVVRHLSSAPTVNMTIRTTESTTAATGAPVATPAPPLAPEYLWSRSLNNVRGRGATVEAGIGGSTSHIQNIYGIEMDAVPSMVSTRDL